MYQLARTVLENFFIDFSLNVIVPNVAKFFRTYYDGTDRCKAIECFTPSELSTRTFGILKESRC